MITDVALSKWRRRYCTLSLHLSHLSFTDYRNLSQLALFYQFGMQLASYTFGNSSQNSSSCFHAMLQDQCKCSMSRKILSSIRV
jgi:hypothetical protein